METLMFGLLSTTKLFLALFKDSKFNRLALMEKWPNFENLPQGMEKPVTFLIFKLVSQFTLVAQSVER